MTGIGTGGTDITPSVLLKAYACGIFPMAESAGDNALYWIDPEERGVLPLDKFHVPKRLARTVASERFEIRIDTAFTAVVAACAAPGKGRSNTWINGRISRLYTALFELGHCHSVEVWRENRLVGGLYGVRLAGAFFGESMFSTERDASKVALVHLVARLKAGKFALLDTQFVTDHLSQFGVTEISREAYHEKLEAALRLQGDFFRLGVAGFSGAAALQVLSQTS